MDVASNREVKLMSCLELRFGCSWERIREFRLGFKHLLNSEDRFYTLLP